MHPDRQPWSLLGALYADEPTARIFSEPETVRSWLAVEAALAQAQADAGVLTREEADAIAGAAVLENIDLAALREGSRNVGYPILPLVRMIAAALPDSANGRVHLGATTQDIMDTGLALQLRAALDRLGELLDAYGTALVDQMEAHRHTLLAARTHAQQAVPTTFGAKLATYVAELARHRARLAAARERACRVSLHGAGGTSAAMGAHAPAVRAALAERLGLGPAEVPWHVARDALAEVGLAVAAVAATCARFAREVVDLSRTEVGEVAEQDGHHRGASSTMPQKANPIGAEAIIGLAVTVGALAPALLRAMEAGHERAAGEWQVEWHVVPQVATLGAGALAMSAEVCATLRVNAEAMRANLVDGRGFVMAEAYMMRAAPILGRERAHDLVYMAAQRARERGVRLEEALREVGLMDAPGMAEIRPDDYTGDPDRVCDAALAAWQAETYVVQSID